MKPKVSPYRYISVVTESGKPAVVRGKAYPWKDGYVTFNAVDGGGEIIIHSRYVHARWFAAWRSAKRSAKRFRASVRDGGASPRTNGGKIKVRFTGCEADCDLASCGQKEACLSSTLMKGCLLSRNKPANGVQGYGRDTTERRGQISDE